MPSTWRVIDLIHWAESYLKEKKFDNIKVLKKQIEKDIFLAKKILNKNK